MKISTLRVLVNLVALMGGFGIFRQPASSASSSQSRPNEQPTVSVCELIKESSRYDQKEMRLRAFYLRTDRYTKVFDLFLYDPQCNSEKSQMLLLGLEFDNWDKLRGQMWKMFPAETCDRAELTTVGKFLVFKNPVHYRDFVKYGFEISKFEAGHCLAEDEFGYSKRAEQALGADSP